MAPASVSPRRADAHPAAVKEEELRLPASPAPKPEQAQEAETTLPANSALSYPSTAGKMCTRWHYSKSSLQAPPLDYSFRGISFMQDLLTEEPRPGLRAIKQSESGRLLTQAVWLNNNTLNDLTDFPEIIGKLLEYPEDIYWIDLSFNDLPNIDPVLTTYYNLHNLNLHGNSIQSLSEVDKLAVLPHLRSLTLHGNPIEEEKGYRSYVVSTLPNLKSFDFSGVTKLDRSTANVWRRMNIKPKRVRKKRDDF